MSYKIDFTTIQHSSTERVVGKDYDGALIYEQTFTGTYTNNATSRTSVVFIRGFSGRIINGFGQIQAANNAGVLQKYSACGWQVGEPISNPIVASELFVSTTGSLQLAIYNRYATTNAPYRVTVQYTKGS